MINKKENNTVKSILKGTVIAGALFAGTTLSANACSNLFNYDILGSGAEVRSELLAETTAPYFGLDANCGEKSAETKTDAKTTTEAKCGDGKCGDKTTAKTDTTTESKTKDAKCGDGKCGADAKKAPATTTSETPVKK